MSDLAIKSAMTGISLVFTMPALAQTPDAAPAAGARATSMVNLDDIVVTARRRDERLQDVPVSVVAFSGEALEKRGVREMTDLPAIVPGFRFSYEGSKNYNVVSLRGIGQIPVGEGTPGVVTYFANVPMPALSSNASNFDIASIQVLKGPQGTLFGRNTLGGAVLITPQLPTYDFSGYVSGIYGRYDRRELEGAINLPIVDGKVALRVAAQVRRQDPRTRNLSGGEGFDNIHQDAFRASLLIEPLDGVKNTTIFDYLKANERPAGIYLYKTTPGLVPFADSLLAGYVAGQLAAGPRAAYSDLRGGGYDNRKVWGITNDTQIELGDVTVRNIFGYRHHFNANYTNTSGVGELNVPIGPGGAIIPFRLLSSSANNEREYLTNELQVFGKAFDGKIDWIVGGFYSKDKNSGPSGANYTAFVTNVLGINPNTYTTSLNENKNVAVFAQVGVDLSDMVIQGLKLNAGGRYTWDKASACGGTFAGGYVGFGACLERAALGLADGTGIVKNKGDAPSWTLGLDYKASDNILLYAVTRRGYRGVNVNTPLFETPFTTGGRVVPDANGVGCTGPGNICPDFRAYQKTGKETLTDYEIGFKSDWSIGDVRGRLNTAAFLSKYRDALQFFNIVGTGIYQSAPDAPTNTAVGINAADETMKGIELEATVIASPNLSFSFTGAYTKSKVDRLINPTLTGAALTTDQITLPSPKYSGTIAGSWTMPVRPMDGEVVLNGDFYFTSKFAAQYGQKLDGYTTANARLDWNDIGGSGVDLGVFVRNLFNNVYFTSAVVMIPGYATNTKYAGEPRTWGLTARYRFGN